MKPTEITINGKVFRTLEAVVYRLADQEPKSMDMTGYLPVVIDGDLKLWAIPGDLSPYALKSYVDEQDEKKQDKYIGRTLTLEAGAWADKQQVKAVEGVTDTNLVQVCPVPSDISKWGDNGVICFAQAADQLTFRCDIVPEENITVLVIIWG